MAVLQQDYPSDYGNHCQRQQQLTTLRNSANELRAAGFDVTPGPSKPVTKQKSLKKTSKLSSTISFTDVVIGSSYEPFVS